MPNETYDIQELVTQSGVPRRTVYFYVQQGVLPPPEGAGLAAHYNGAHLLRLRLIPLLRQQGLRLDEIRVRFAQLSEDEMRAMLHTSRPAPAPSAPRAAREPLTPEYTAIPPGWGQQRFVHYNLPARMALVVPESLSAADRQRLNQLIHAARQIFAGGPVVMMGASPRLDEKESSEADRPDVQQGARRPTGSKEE